MGAHAEHRRLGRPPSGGAAQALVLDTRVRGRHPNNGTHTKQSATTRREATILPRATTPTQCAAARNRHRPAHASAKLGAPQQGPATCMARPRRTGGGAASGGWCGAVTRARPSAQQVLSRGARLQGAVPPTPGAAANAARARQWKARRVRGRDRRRDAGCKSRGEGEWQRQSDRCKHHRGVTRCREREGAISRSRNGKGGDTFPSHKGGGCREREGVISRSHKGRRGATQFPSHEGVGCHKR